jgi:hypothetical protein
MMEGSRYRPSEFGAKLMMTFVLALAITAIVVAIVWALGWVIGGWKRRGWK